MLAILRGMSGIDGSRTVPAAALLGRIGAAPLPTRQHANQRPAPYVTDAAAPTEPARGPGLQGAARPAYAAGFLAQMIAQESLLLGARGQTTDQREPTELYQRAQGDDTTYTGQQTDIDLMI